MGALDDVIDNAGKKADEEIAKMKAKTEEQKQQAELDQKVQQKIDENK